ncbi:MAG: glycosyltransferase [Chthoniobacteraceae bacterium]
MLRPVSVITVTNGGYFFVRLLVEKVREFTSDRKYEIIAVDLGSKDGTSAWLKKQPDVRVIRKRQWFTNQHRHGENAEEAVRAAKYEHIALLDSDAFPIQPDWLSLTIDKLDDETRIAGAEFNGKHKGNPYGWYIHPHFMTFCKSDLEKLVILRKIRGHDTDTGEEATIRVLDAGLKIIRYPLELCVPFAVGHPRVPTVSAGVFHAWYVTRLIKEKSTVDKETGGSVTRENYQYPLQDLLRKAYSLDY